MNEAMARMWGGSPPGHKPKQITKAPESRYAQGLRAIAKLDKALRVPGGFLAAIEFFDQTIDPMTGNRWTNKGIAAMIQDAYKVKVTPRNVALARWVTRTDAGTIPKEALG